MSSWVRMRWATPCNAIAVLVQWCHYFLMNREWDFLMDTVQFSHIILPVLHVIKVWLYGWGWLDTSACSNHAGKSGRWCICGQWHEKVNMLNNSLKLLQYIIITTVCLFWTHQTHGIVWRNPQNMLPWSGEGSPENLFWWSYVSTSNNRCLENKWSWPNLWQDVKSHGHKYCCLLFNQSILRGCFPMIWKQLNIVPIPKNGDTTNQTNYRPICLLSILSKHLERHIVNLLLQHLLETRPISDSQWGFQSGEYKYTVAALLEITTGLMCLKR